MITEGQVMDIAREALYLIIKVSAPLLENIVSFMTELWGNFGLYLR